MTTPTDAEVRRLETVAADSWYARGANAASIRYRAEVFGRWFTGSACLELGPAEGLISELLAERFTDLTLVEGSPTFVAELRRKLPRATVVESLFERYEPGRRFDTIVLGHVLEHVDDPAALLRRVRDWLAEGGVLLASVPNARSLHRQLGVIMGLLPHERALNEADRHHGHRRVYDPESFRAEFTGAGLGLRFFGGYWMKLLSNAQLDAQWSAEQLYASMALGERYPDLSCEIYVVAGR